MIKSEERDKVQKGYTRQFDLYIIIRGKCLVASYGSVFAKTIHTLEGLLEQDLSISELAGQLRDSYKAVVSHNLKFYFNALPEIDTSNAVQLQASHYGDYVRFFTTQYPNAKADAWLYE
jgi:hypothetical protein